MLEEPMCRIRKCKYYDGVYQPDGTEPSERNVFKAFPKRLPSEIAYGRNKHLTPYPGDHGIQYEEDWNEQRSR